MSVSNPPSPSPNDALEEILKAQLPWPKDIFGEVPEGDWAKIHKFAEGHLGYPIDRISGDLMRSGWNIRQRYLDEAKTALTQYIKDNYRSNAEILAMLPDKRHKDYRTDTPNLSPSSVRRQKSINWGYNLAIDDVRDQLNLTKSSEGDSS